MENIKEEIVKDLEKVNNLNELNDVKVKIKDLSAITLEMLASLNSMHRKQERLIEIASDGTITDDEIDDFINIQNELERISLTVESLQLWSEQMLANGKINAEEYHRRKKSNS